MSANAMGEGPKPVCTRAAESRLNARHSSAASAGNAGSSSASSIAGASP